MPRVFQKCPAGGGVVAVPIAWLVAVILFALPQAALACSLDGIASISMNGTRATLTAGTPTQSDAQYWAPFTLLAAGRGSTLHFSEDQGNVRKSLPSSILRTPLLWNFDDGGTARGWTASHVFRSLGWHRLTVSYYWPANARWIEFDSAQFQIVRPGDLLQANLLYTLEDGVGGLLVNLLRLAIWASAAVIVGAAIVSRVQRGRRMRIR